jgi:sec-independent protein translocase protein TatA
MSSIGPTELIIVAIVALLILGPKRLPEAGRGLGRSLREFKDGLSAKREATEIAEPADAP